MKYIAIYCGKGQGALLKCSCNVATQIERSIYSNRTVSTLCLTKNWHFIIAYSYITSLAIAVHDVQYAVEAY